MWKTADRSVISRVTGDLSRGQRWGASGKYFPLSDLFALTICSPHKCLKGTRVGAHDRLVPTRNPQRSASALPEFAHTPIGWQ